MRDELSLRVREEDGGAEQKGRFAHRGTNAIVMVV